MNKRVLPDVVPLRCARTLLVDGAVPAELPRASIVVRSPAEKIGRTGFLHSQKQCTRWQLYIATKAGWDWRAGHAAFIDHDDTNLLDFSSFGVPVVSVDELVKGASVVIYPSLYEGFGLPVLESIMLDVPVITTSESSLPEAGGQLAHYIRGRDPAELAERLHVVLGNQKVTDSLARKEHLSRFDPVSISRQWQDLYGR